jgi:V8-like Glu-specific endopeptidase
VTRLAALLALLALPAAAQEGATLLSEAEHREWAAVGRVNVGGFRTRGTCTGTLVAPDLVLTAAHCVPARAVRGKEPEEVHFLAGWFRDTYAAHRTASAIHVHPDRFKGEAGPGRLRADIALIVLDAPIPAEEVPPMPLGPLPTFADDLEIFGYSNRRPGVMARVGPCLAIPVSDDTIGTTCPVISGNSGAPVLRPGPDGWAVVAVTVATSTGDGTLRSYAVRTAEVLFEMAGREMP